jgi:pimeloyl-ACP methyl ester carboxylesterase
MTTYDLLRFDDWTDPVRPAVREVASLLPDEDEGRPPVLFLPGATSGAWAFAEHWLPHTAGRGFPAHVLTPRPGGGLREYVHDAVQTAASLPRQAVLVGHGSGAAAVARALGRYPARAAVLVSPVLGGWASLGTAVRAHPGGTLPAIFGGRQRFTGRQLFGAGLPAEQIADCLGRLEPRPLGGLLRRVDPPRAVGGAPVLVAGSPDDRVVSRKALDRAAAAYAGAPLMFPGMGHDLMLEPAWAEPIDAILDWLTKQL